MKENRLLELTAKRELTSREYAELEEELQRCHARIKELMEQIDEAEFENRVLRERCGWG